jgi:hypothetical protein
MLITFRSKAAADVLMYETHAKPLLDLLGKDVQRGVITAEETGEAIASLEAAIADHKRSSGSGAAGSNGAADDASDHPAEQRVSFAARAFPLLEMLRAAQREGQFVMWGV